MNSLAARTTRFNLRSVMHSLLISLMVLSPLQASVHDALMSSQAMVHSTPAPHMDMAHQHHRMAAHTPEQAEATSHHQPSESPCMELCLMVSIVPALPLLGANTTSSAVTPLPEGKPHNLAQPAAPPPKTALF